LSSFSLFYLLHVWLCSFFGILVLLCFQVHGSILFFGVFSSVPVYYFSRNQFIWCSISVYSFSRILKGSCWVAQWIGVISLAWFVPSVHQILSEICWWRVYVSRDTNCVFRQLASHLWRGLLFAYLYGVFIKLIFSSVVVMSRSVLFLWVGLFHLRNKIVSKVCCWCVFVLRDIGCVFSTIGLSPLRRIVVSIHV